MSIDLPDYKEIVARSQADLKGELPELDPTIDNSLSKAIIIANSGRHYDNVLSIAQLEKELFPITANRQNLERWAAYDGIYPFPALQAQGNVIITGVIGTIIDKDKQYRSALDNLYSVVSESTIDTKITSITSLTRSGTTVTAVTSEPHLLATNIIATISGAVESDYNGAYAITVLSITSFSYEITGTPTTPATGTIIVSCNCAVVAISSDNFGLAQNLDSGAELTEVSITEADLDPIGYVDLTGIIGGQDTESSLSLYNRTIYVRANPVANFNVAAITREAAKIQGVTRIKVKRVTPSIGFVTILFVRDNDDNIIPSASEVLEVKNQILTILQATSEESDVIVTAPTPVTTDYVFTSITPSTQSMKAAIIANLEAFYTDIVTFETNITEDQYRAAIIDTIDITTGEKLTAFTLSSPSSDIIVGTDSIGILGNVTF